MLYNKNMPIVIPEGGKDYDFYNRLSDSGSAVIDDADARCQDIRPARIGLLNLMPAPVMEDTELRWLRSISYTALQIEPVLMKFDDDVRDSAGSSRQEILQRYEPFSDVAERGLDGLIVTGDNQERRADGSLQPFDELHYDKDLREVIDWADSNVKAIIYSCLASHYALKYDFGLDRELNNPKSFGVYRHDIVKQSSIVENMDDIISAPHSRWGNIPTNDLHAAGVEVLAANDQIGWLLAEASTSTGGLKTYIQGHPEYWRYDLHGEYMRDRKNVPANYYHGDNPANKPSLSWTNDSRALLGNWVTRIYNDYSL